MFIFVTISIQNNTFGRHLIGCKIHDGQKIGVDHSADETLKYVLSLIFRGLKKHLS